MQLCGGTEASLLCFPIPRLDLRDDQRMREVVFRLVHSNDDRRMGKLRSGFNRRCTGVRLPPVTAMLGLPLFAIS